MSTIRVNRIHVRANHGCWEEEAIIGGDYIVDVAMEVDFRAAAAADDLTQTVDYCVAKEIVYREMAVRAKLIETVCYRIIDSIRAEVPRCEKAWVKITKINAPTGGHVESVSVEAEG
jgi:dihydroneopterin aldolase